MQAYPSDKLSAVDGASPPSTADRRRAWLHLAMGVALVLLFMFGIGSLAQSIPGAAHMAQVIEERDLRATAIYYTDFEEPAEGSYAIRTSLDYRPIAR